MRGCADTRTPVMPPMSPGAPGPRPRDEIRDAKKVLELQLGEQIAAFNPRCGITICAIHVESVGAGSAPGEPLMRLVRET